jgi:hypothetical protein
MSALGDTLATKNREAASASTLIVEVDSLTTAETPTYSIRLAAPSYSEVLLEEQTAAEVAAALTEYTDWVAALW